MPEGDYSDQTRTCEDCGDDYIWKAGEQEFFAMQKPKPFPPPKRCRGCRAERKRAGVYGDRVSTIDTVTREVLCSRCSNPASRLVSTRRLKALCTVCSGLSGGTPIGDRITVEEWITTIGPVVAQRMVE